MRSVVPAGSLLLALLSFAFFTNQAQAVHFVHGHFGHPHYYHYPHYYYGHGTHVAFGFGVTRVYAPPPVYVVPPPVVYYPPPPVIVAPPPPVVVQPPPTVVVPPPPPAAPPPAPAPVFSETGRRYHRHGDNAGRLDWVEGTLQGQPMRIYYDDFGRVARQEFVD